MTPPSSILVASDLSAQSDRALARAIMLANTWSAELTVIHVLASELSWPDYDERPSWRRSSDRKVNIESDIRADLATFPTAKIRILDGEPGAAIVDLARKEQFDLIIVGESRRGMIGGGATLDALFRSAPTSTLVIKNRPRHDYRKIVVGTDFTEEALVALESAASLFPAASLALLHSFDVPYRSLMSDSPLGHEFGALEKETIRNFIDRAALADSVKAKVATYVEHGDPAEMLGRYAADNRVDLTVIGAYPRGRLFHYLVGGYGPRIVERVVSDVLVVRPR
nr:universal stress protein [Devosia oryzisoli]